jgi:hypothetical protein
MNDLLSLAARRRILAAYSSYIDRDEVDTIFWLFHYGCGFPEGRLDPRIAEQGEHAWDDAEQFLETLDNARSDAAKAAAVASALSGLEIIAQNSGQGLVETASPRLNAFRRGHRPTARALAAMARRMVAASCCTFLDGVDHVRAREKERWQPYQEWLRWLRQDDSVLTFNYDRVVELLRPIIGEVTAIGPITAGVRVREIETLESNVNREHHGAWLYKLHGSVNWKIDDSGKLSHQEWAPAMLGNNYSLAIATPGDSKMEMAGGIFQRLWEDATKALREADDVFIVGFRFPPSDAFPRDKLLGALRGNEKRSLNVHVVLGPELNTDRRRVAALLEWTLGLKMTHGGYGDYGGRTLISHDMWAEDFLNMWSQLEAHRDKVERPSRPS